MFVNFKRPLIKRVRWTKHRKTVKSIACPPSQIPYIQSAQLVCAILVKRTVRPLSVCRWKQSATSAATSDILVSNALGETAFVWKKKGHFSSVCLSKSKHPAQTVTLTSQQPSLFAASPVNSDDDKVNVFALVNGVLASCLIDTGAKRNHIDKSFY